jgi:hypothetical protein
MRSGDGEYRRQRRALRSPPGPIPAASGFRETLRVFIEPRFARPELAVVVYTCEITAQHSDSRSVSAGEAPLPLDAAITSPGLRCTSPLSSGMVPSNALTKTLPVPLRPMSPTRSPAWMASEAPSKVEAERGFCVLECDQCHGGPTTDSRFGQIHSVAS